MQVDTSDFVAMISRARGSRIEAKAHTSQLFALKDLLENWDDTRDSFKAIGGLLVEDLMYDDSNKILYVLLAGLDGDTLFDNIKEAGYNLEGDAIKRLVDMLLDEMDDDTKAALLQEKGFFPRES